MHRFWLHVCAPFAAFRGMQAGVYRATSPIIPPSAAYGLVLNLAGIEMRDSTPGVTTGIRTDLPQLRIALGTRRPAEMSVLYQQLHSYPVGNSGKQLQERTRGAKYWIAPARRELLVGLDAVLGIEAPDAQLCDRVRRGLAGDLEDSRYGLPFAGDNNLLFDRIEMLESPPEVKWYVRVEPGDAPRRGSARLTVGIDRGDSSRTTSTLMAPLEVQCVEPPESAWTWTPRAPSPRAWSAPSAGRLRGPHVAMPQGDARSSS